MINVITNREFAKKAPGRKPKASSYKPKAESQNTKLYLLWALSFGLYAVGFAPGCCDYHKVFF
jgi:hypothetical protein